MTPAHCFACAWVIRPDTDFHELMHDAAECSCELVAVAPIQISQQGYAALTFALRTTEEAHLVAFIQRVGGNLGLTHWYSVPESYFEQGTPLHLQLVDPAIRDQWLAGMNAYGKHNDTLRAKLENGV